MTAGITPDGTYIHKQIIEKEAEGKKNSLD